MAVSTSATEGPGQAPATHPVSASGWVPVFVFASLLVIFLTFPSRTYDGDALKRFGVTFGHFHLERADHPYANAYFMGWWTLVKGFASEDVINRIDWLVAMNSALGAAAAGIGSAWLARLGLGRIPVLIGGWMLGLTSASVYHSTQTTEPISAQFWLMLSLFVGAIPRLGIWSGILSGACWATSVASYQSYFLAGPFVLWLHARRWRELVPWVGAAGVTGFFWFGLAAHVTGHVGLSGFIRYVTTKHDGDYWGFLSLGQTARVPFGFAGAVAMPWPSRSWPGLKLGFQQLTPGWKVLCSVQILVTWCLAAGAVLLPVSDPLRRYRWPLLLGFAACTFPPLYLSPQYWKLWLLPVALMQLLGILVASSRRWGTWILTGCLAMQVATNVPRLLVRPHAPDSLPINTARALKESIRPTDLLICDAWGDASLYCAANPDQNLLNLMSHLDGLEGIRSIVRTNLAQGRRVYLYGIVDRSLEAWSHTDLGTRPKLIKFEEVQELKRSIGPVIWNGAAKGCSETLYELKSL